RYDLIDFLFIEPAALIKFSESIVTQLDLGVNAYIKEDYWVGLAYRTGSGNRIAHETMGGRGASLNVFGGVRVDKYFFGYSFDYTFSSISSRTLGSHEIMLGAKFGDSARRYRWLNRY
ncbi:MAG: type IX secretion system membrane protein PorP/SprF, partial [Bacteroidales bacterium]|nr:type IX secretion system membrane protein PorP/SprF [Bacteroidales bacterium]